jgi:hypothetical protein
MLAENPLTLSRVSRQLGKKEKAARTVPAKVAPAERKAVVDRATSRVSAKAQINFRRSVRG